MKFIEIYTSPCSSISSCFNRGELCTFSSQTNCFHSPSIEFHCLYLRCLVQDPRPLYKITAREQISSLTKQVIGWYLKGWNSDAFLKKALSCEPCSKAASAVDVPYFPRSHFTLAFQSAPLQGIHFPLISCFSLGLGMKMEIQTSHCVILSSLIWINLFHAAFCQRVLQDFFFFFLHSRCSFFVHAVDFLLSF